MDRVTKHMTNLFYLDYCLLVNMFREIQVGEMAEFGIRHLILSRLLLLLKASSSKRPEGYFSIMYKRQSRIQLFGCAYTGRLPLAGTESSVTSPLALDLDFYLQLVLINFLHNPRFL